jgi:hypothetical protein
MTAKEVRKKLSSFDTFSFRNNVFTVKKSYYWGFSKSGETYANKVKEIIPEAKIIDFGNHFASFKGGAKAGSAGDSYFYVKFTIGE